MNVLVVGGTGYIGSHVCLDLAGRGHRVTSVARRSGSTDPARAAQLEAAGVVLRHADLLRRGALNELDGGEFDVIVHGVCSFLEPATGESLTLRAAEEVVALAKRCPRRPLLVDLSSNLVYTPPAEGVLPNEDHPCSPETVHGRNKRAAEVMLQESGLPWVLLRIGQVYGGPGSSFDWVMVDPIRKQEFPVPCAGENRVALVHVDDVAQAVRRVIEGPVRNRAFNIASGDVALTLGQVFDEVARGFRLPSPRRLPLTGALVFAWFSEHGARLFGREPKLVVDMIRVLSANRSLDIARARVELGFEPAWPDTLAGIRAAYGPVFTGERPVFNPGGRLSAAMGTS